MIVVASLLVQQIQRSIAIAEDPTKTESLKKILNEQWTMALKIFGGGVEM